MIPLRAYKELSVRELFKPQCVQPLESAWLASLSNNISFEDAALVRKIQEGDVDAFEHLVLKYQDRVYNICLRTVGHAEDARDLAQETFLKAFDAISRFEHKSSFYTWLFRIAVNLSISSRRRDRKVPSSKHQKPKRHPRPDFFNSLGHKKKFGDPSHFTAF